MVGGGHQAHAERRAEQERVEVLAVLAIGEAGEADEDDEREGEHEQEEAEEGGHGIVDEHAREQFLVGDAAEGGEAAGGNCKVDGDGDAEEREYEGIDPGGEARDRANSMMTIVAQTTSSGRKSGKLTWSVSEVRAWVRDWRFTIVYSL